MLLRNALYVSIVALCLQSCSSEDEDPDVGSETDVGDTTDDTAIGCCPIEPRSCDCISIGGPMGPGGTCVSVCDGTWGDIVDDNGCPRYESGPGSCGLDVGDAGDTSDADVFECCPLEAPSCDCPLMGGSPGPDGECRSAPCDAVPSGWVVGEDDNGCPVYTEFSPDSCFEPMDAGAD